MLEELQELASCLTETAKNASEKQKVLLIR